MSRFRVTNLIEKKRNGQELSAEEIEYFVQCLRKDNTDDRFENIDRCQIGAMLMAIYLKSFTDDETRVLTTAMKNSGEVLSWPSEYSHLIVDKHSTGGVGDKVSLVLAPALAAIGLKVPMISGYSLGHTGGTLNKMLSIPGCVIELSSEIIKKQVETVGCCIVGQTENLVPADKVLYNCRDLTATVTNNSLITASIVSKKLAEGISSIVYDVKFGKGAFCESESQALDLAKRLVSASTSTKCSAILTRMGCPIGNQIGNSLEVTEAVECLQGQGPEDLIELVELLGGALLSMIYEDMSLEQARGRINQVLNNGDALKKFYEMIIAQGVKKQTAEELCYGCIAEVLPKCVLATDIVYDGPSGYVQDIDAKFLGCFCMDNLPSNLSSATGFTIHKHVGDKISKGDVWLVVHHEKKLSEEILESLNQALFTGTEDNGTRTRAYKRITLNQKGEFTISDLS